MHIGVLEDDLDQQALMKLWLCSAQHSVDIFDVVRVVVGVAAARSPICVIEDVFLHPVP